jgi:hypothetical protein
LTGELAAAVLAGEVPKTAAAGTALGVAREEEEEEGEKWAAMVASSQMDSPHITTPPVDRMCLVSPLFCRLRPRFHTT